MNQTPVHVEHYSDILCVWAYIAQVRIAELKSRFGDAVRIEYRFLQVFGHVRSKMSHQWAERGGLEAYAAHVQEIAAGFDHIRVAADAWRVNTPASSLPAHLLLCGLKALGAGSEVVERLVLALREAFFVERTDISRHDQLMRIAAAAGCDTAHLQAALDDGSAHAQLAADLADATAYGVRSSPTLRLNEGRQTLTGNVGYRVLEANIRELLRHPGDQQSWC